MVDAGWAEAEAYGEGVMGLTLDQTEALVDAGWETFSDQTLVGIESLADALLARRRDRERCKRAFAERDELKYYYEDVKIQRDEALADWERARQSDDRKIAQLSKLERERDELRGQLAEAQKALDACGIGGIEAEFQSLGDAISQMAWHIKELTRKPDEVQRRLAAAEELAAVLKGGVMDKETPERIWLVDQSFADDGGSSVIEYWWCSEPSGDERDVEYIKVEAAEKRIAELEKLVPDAGVLDMLLDMGECGDKGEYPEDDEILSTMNELVKAIRCCEYDKLQGQLAEAVQERDNLRHSFAVLQKSSDQADKDRVIAQKYLAEAAEQRLAEAREAFVLLTNTMAWPGNRPTAAVSRAVCKLDAVLKEATDAKD